jgi:hypothetical protein
MVAVVATASSAGTSAAGRDAPRAALRKPVTSKPDGLRSCQV